ncbi:MAG TPA: DinB family protein [Gemmatimonadaceae bacterium]|nr:DinB family protein [Gemmatimonadaceae bacterium]
MLTVADLLEELEQEARSTRRALERVPDDKLEWRPHERSFTLGVLAMHIATLPAAIAGVSVQAGFDAKTPVPRPSARSRAELLETLDRSVAEAKRVLTEMGDAGLAEPWTMKDGEKELMSLPRGKFLRNVMLNHWYHHRGQLTVYLRQVGAKVPAIYGASADETPFPG